MTSLNWTPSYKELVYNLECMEKTIQQGKAKDLDRGFLELFQTAVDALNDKKLQRELNLRLSTSAAKIYDASNFMLNPVKPKAVRPLVGTVRPLKEFAALYSAGEIKTGLEKLIPMCDIQPIAQDGHCLFRSVAVGIVHYFRKVAVPQQQLFFTNLQEQVANLADQDPELKPAFDKVQKSIFAVADKKTTAEELLNDKVRSDELVAFLRRLACAYNQKPQDNATLDAFFSICEGGKYKYLRDMRTMENKEFGTHVELNALEQTLLLDLRAIDIRSIGNGKQSLAACFEKVTDTTVHLLLYTNHYDVGIAV